MVYNVDTLNMVDIGWTGENNATVISIDVKSWLGRWPDAQISLVVCRPKEDVFYPVVVEQKNHFAIWRVTLADVSIPGMGNAVLYAKSQNEDVIAKHPFRLRVNAALDSALKDPPEVGREWLEQVLDAADRAEAAQASYYTPKMDGYELGWEPSREGLPALPKVNVRGEKGQTGVGVASIQQTHKSTEDGGLNVWQATLTDGTQSAFTVVNGSKGSQGVPGERGPQGEPGVQGERGRGIRSIDEINTSTEDGGYNMWDVIMTDGSLDARLYVRNGSKGSTGEPGPAGPQGLPGASVSITSISESTEDDGYSVVTFSDGKTLRVKNGSKGSAGEGGTGGGVVTVYCQPSDDMQSFTASMTVEEIRTAFEEHKAVQAIVLGMGIVAHAFMVTEDMVAFSGVATVIGESMALMLSMMADGTNIMTISALGGMVVANITTEDGETYTTDKTAAELYAAVSAGMPVYACLMGMYIPAQNISDGQAVFRVVFSDGTVTVTLDNTNVVNVEISPAGGGGALRVVVERTNPGECTSSMTSSEIFAAVEAGQQVECLAHVGNTVNLFLRPAVITPEMVLFGGVYGSSALGLKNQYCSVIVTNNTHMYSFTPLDKLPNPEPLTINGTSYDGSEAVNISIDELASAVIAKLPRYGGETA